MTPFHKAAKAELQSFMQNEDSNDKNSICTGNYFKEIMNPYIGKRFHKTCMQRRQQATHTALKNRYILFIHFRDSYPIAAIEAISLFGFSLISKKQFNFLQEKSHSASPLVHWKMFWTTNQQIFGQNCWILWARCFEV